MLRRFTKEVGRYSNGSLRDYPREVWNTIARSAGMALESFTVEVDESDPGVDKGGFVRSQSPLKGRPRIQKRLGAV